MAYDVQSVSLNIDTTAIVAKQAKQFHSTNDARIEAAAQEFEAMFIMQMLKPMFDTVPVNETFGGGNGEEVMRSFMLQEYGSMIAQKGILGISDQIKAEMLRAQEARQASQSQTTSNAIASYNQIATQGVYDVAH